MNKIVLAGAVVVVGVAVFALWSNRDHEVPVEGTTVPQAAPEPAPLIEPAPEPMVAPEPVEEPAEEPAAEPVDETLNEAVDETRDAAQVAAQRIEQGAATAADGAADGAQDAADAFGDAVNTAAGALSSTADNVADGIQSLTRNAGQALNSANTNRAAVNVAADAGMTPTEVEQALSADTFDYNRAVTIIDSSDLSDPNKTLLLTMLDQARADPSLLRAALEQVRTALSM